MMYDFPTAILKRVAYALRLAHLVSMSALLAGFTGGCGKAPTEAAEAQKDAAPPNPAVDLSRMQAIVDAAKGYQTEFGSWPKGDYAEIIRSLGGDNPRRVTFLVSDRRFVNSNGELVDSWGTPFQLSFSGERPEVVSAGKDKMFGTPDDLVVPKS